MVKNENLASANILFLFFYYFFLYYYLFLFYFILFHFILFYFLRGCDIITISGLGTNCYLSDLKFNKMGKKVLFCHF